MSRKNNDGSPDKRFTKHSEEHRKKISESLKGRTLSDTHKKNIGSKAEGRVWSEERREKIMSTHLAHRMEAIGGEENIPDIVKMHLEGATYYAISKKYKCSSAIIERVVEDNK